MIDKNGYSYVWIVEELFPDGKGHQVAGFKTRAEAREYAKYYNGFAHGTRTATYRARKYVRV